MKVTFTSLLFLLFLGLKLTGYITWSWLWITAPLWIPIVLIGGFFALVGIGVGVFKVIESKVANEKKA